MRGRDGEEVGCAKASAKMNDRCAVRFKVHGVKANSPEEGKKKTPNRLPVCW